MEITCPYILKLRDMTRAWGGDIQMVPRTTDYFHDNAFSDAPFTSGLGLYWGRKLILITPQTEWHEVVHEMGHLFATLDPPEDSEETLFFGWEHCLVKMLGAPWEEWWRDNDLYSITWVSIRGEKSLTVGEIPKMEIPRFLAEKIRAAQDSGLVNAALEPLAIR